MPKLLVAIVAVLPILAGCSHTPLHVSSMSHSAGRAGEVGSSLELVRMCTFTKTGLHLRGGGKELKIEHRAFVANLPRTLTNEGLREAFAEFGKVKEARVCAQSTSFPSNPCRARSTLEMGMGLRGGSFCLIYLAGSKGYRDWAIAANGLRDI